MKVLRTGVLLGLAWGVYMAIASVNPVEPTVTLATVILQFSFSRWGLEFPLTCQMLDLLRLATELFPYFLFEIVYGVWLYRHFCTASVYYFSRRTDRGRWFLRSAGELLLATALFLTLMFLTAAAITALRFTLVIDGAGIALAVYHLALHILWLYGMTLAINLLSIAFGSAIGFGGAAALQAASIVLLNLWDWLLPLDGSGDTLLSGYLLWLNPIAHLILSWHSSVFPALEQEINCWGISFDLNVSLLGLLAANLILLAAGTRYIQRCDIIGGKNDLGSL